ncbi:MAG: DUF5998 family protein [Tetrasphaera jenkinsii]|jgi:hypothetical protein|uniref:Phosphodiesterase n=1 Tax=Nostocoides jenkinsii Ben 74 TaxID=1193518 RepID=A0A077MDU8_9MICO|nr:DUF5998 family protein [Tetrasphaera jenkinsii]MCI1261382.1 DUF5998 family protein [Tetrasphaera jenkinsii]CCI52973.1 conserved hypothetical protein [Tetrasphaera jenkinsii Ben 74]
MSPRPQRPALTLLPAPLRSAIERAGYYPQLVCDVIGAALADEEVRAHLVHQDTTFDHDVIRRHVTVLVLTPSRLIIAHADDFTDDPNGDEDVATATTESVPLSLVRGIMLTHVVPNPRAYRPGSLGREITLTVGWGTVNRVDLLPASCGDPNCGADHGFEGTIASDDLVLRISADADGSDKLTEAMAFAHALSASVGS